MNKQPLPRPLPPEQDIQLPAADAEDAEIRSRVRDAHKALRQAVARAVEDISHDVRVLKISHLADGKVVEFPLYRGQWVSGPDGLKMMLIDDINHCPQRECPLCETNSGCGVCTRVLASGNSRMPAHSHGYREYIQVIQGELIEHTTGARYAPGETIYYAGDYVHEPELNGLAMVCWQPPLPRHASPPPEPGA